MPNVSWLAEHFLVFKETKGANWARKCCFLTCLSQSLIHVIQIWLRRRLRPDILHTPNAGWLLELSRQGTLMEKLLLPSYGPEAGIFLMRKGSGWNITLLFCMTIHVRKIKHCFRNWRIRTSLQDIMNIKFSRRLPRCLLCPVASTKRYIFYWTQMLRFEIMTNNPLLICQTLLKRHLS